MSEEQQKPFSYYCPFCVKLDLSESEIVGTEGHFRHQVCGNYLELKTSGEETADDIDVYSKRMRDQMSEYANGLRGLVRAEEKNSLEEFVRFVDAQINTESLIILKRFVDGQDVKLEEVLKSLAKLEKLRTVVEKFKEDNAVHLEPLMAKFPLCPTCRVELGSYDEINYQCPNCSKTFVKGLTPKRKEL